MPKKIFLDTPLPNDLISIVLEYLPDHSTQIRGSNELHSLIFSTYRQQNRYKIFDRLAKDPILRQYMAHLGKTLNKSIYTIETKTLSAHIRGYRSAKLLGSVVLGTYLLFEDVLLTPLAFCAAFVAAGAFKLAKFILSIFKFIFCSKERTLENLAQILIAPISGLKIIIDFFGVAWVAMLLFIGNMLCFSPILARSTMGGINLYLRCTHTIPAVESNLTYLNKHIGRFNQ